jgi:DNA repair protein RecN (Recombination protein N)
VGEDSGEGETLLRLLSVTNFATIEHLEMELSPGFNVLTGETGAGKSIIVDALSLLLGGRADVGMVRAGARRSRVEGIFLLDSEASQRAEVALGEYQIEGSEEELILAREVNLDGRNTCRVNGRIVPLRLLNALAEHLVDIHGQNQQLSLFRVREHLDILDRYGGLAQLRSQMSQQVHDLTGVRRGLARLGMEEQQLAQRMDFLKYQLEEIGNAQLSPGEDEALTLERSRISNAERIIGLADQAYRALYEPDDRGASVMDLLGRVSQSLSQLERLDPSLGRDLREAESLTYQVEELARTLRDYRDSIEYSPDRLQEIEERLGLISGLKRKYGNTVEEVLAFAEGAADELDRIYHNEERLEELKSQDLELQKQVGKLAGQLAQARRVAAKHLAAAIEDEVAELAMEHSRVEVDIRQAESAEGVPVQIEDSNSPSLLPGLLDDADIKYFAFDATGIDSVEFLISPNPGEPLQPLARIASGGEASRLMLAIKVILSVADQIPTLVFDEVDAGVGGRIGSVLGQKLWSLSRNHQVLCVTHLPQIACYSDHHLKVEKSSTGDRTTTSVEMLAKEARIVEISQMLGSASDTSRLNASEMLEQAELWKRDRHSGVGRNPGVGGGFPLSRE